MKKKFIVSILLVCFFASCSIYSSSPYLKGPTETGIQEASYYQLDKADTLVDIGSGDVKFDKIIFHTYPDLFIVLEDFDKIGKFTMKSYLKQDLKNNKFTPTVKTHYRFVAGKEDSIPLPSGIYKTVLCRKTVHDFSNVAKMTAELNRILQKDGILIISEPDPVTTGIIDRSSKKKYFTKTGLDSLFSLQQFERISMDSVTYDSGNMNIMRYKKK